MSDIEQQRVVEDFGRDDAPVRLLIASDIASEGINLHYLSHRMIHFDIPWSLMVFQQRNGRIDRYGQQRTPQIVYLITRSGVPKIRGDMRILELLIAKDKEAVKNIGDPAEFMGVYDIQTEEDITAEAMEAGETPEEFEKSITSKGEDPLAILFGKEEPPKGQEVEGAKRSMPSLFADDYVYVKTAFDYLRSRASLKTVFYDHDRRVDLTLNAALWSRFRFLPREIRPDDGLFVLSADKQAIEDEIRRSRKEEAVWPRIHYLWELNPVVDWINDKLHALFRRHEAPVISLPGGLKAEEWVFLLSGLIPNRKSHPLVHRWFGVCFEKGGFKAIEPFEELMARTGLGRRTYPNPMHPIDVDGMKTLLPEAVKKARTWMSKCRQAFESEINEKLNTHLNALERLRARQHRQLELQLEASRQHEKIIQSRKKKGRRNIDAIFDAYIEWIEETLTTEDNPHIQVVAVFKG